MYTTYLGQELTEEDLVKTLAELGLALSSTLIVAVVSLRSILGCFLKHSSIEKSEYLSHVNLAHGMAFSSQRWLACNFSLKYSYIVQQTGNEKLLKVIS